MAMFALRERVFRHTIIISESDDQFFQMTIINWEKIPDEAAKPKYFQACSRATGETKVAKVYLVGDYVWVSFEAFFESPESLAPVFRRGLTVLEAARKKFDEVVGAA